MRLKPFLRWAGGKQSLVNDLLDNTPPDHLINKYFEPFLGAGSLFFANGFSNAFISDINPQLVNTYKKVKSNYEELDLLLKEFYSRFNLNNAFYYQMRDQFNVYRNEESIEQAARFIFLIHTNYNGMYRVNRKGEYNVPLGKLSPSLPDRPHMKELSRKLKKVDIDCVDYRSIENLVSHNDFVYLDPPYPPLDWNNPQNQFTVNTFSKQDHEDTADFANSLSQKGCFVLISYPDVQFVRELYKNWNIVKLDAFRSISCKKERKKISELLIRNY